MIVATDKKEAGAALLKSLDVFSRDAETVLRALDALALALTDHNHQWSPKLRRLYGRAHAAAVRLAT